MYNEPTAAAIYYIRKYDELTVSNNKFIVYDLGGGTIDTTVVEYHIDNKTCEIIDIDGNSSLGGIDIDNIIVADIYTKYSIDKSDIKWANRIRKCAEDIKIKLSYTKNYDVVLENVPTRYFNN
jgi:molecular chaperone DnaK (HSP70)